MELHLYRRHNGFLLYIQHVVPGVLGVVGEGWAPPQKATLIEWAVATCKYMAGFYARHRVCVSHVVAIQRGWTVEYLEC